MNSGYNILGNLKTERNQNIIGQNREHTQDITPLPRSCFNMDNLKPEYKNNKILINILETFSKETTLPVKNGSNETTLHIDTYFFNMLSKISNKKKFITTENIFEVIATIITKDQDNRNIIYEILQKHNLSEEKKKLEQIIVKIKRTNPRTTYEKNKLAAEIKDPTTKIKDLTTKIEGLKKEIEGLTTKIEGLTTKNNNIVNKINNFLKGYTPKTYNYKHVFNCNTDNYNDISGELSTALETFVNLIKQYKIDYNKYKNNIPKEIINLGIDKLPTASIFDENIEEPTKESHDDFNIFIKNANYKKLLHFTRDLNHYKAIFVIAFELFVRPEIEMNNNLIKFTAAAKLLETVNEPDTNVDEVIKAAASLKMIEALNEPAEVDTNLENLLKLTSAAKLLETIKPETENAEVTNLENLLKLTSAAKLLETIKDILVVMTTTSYVNGEKKVFEDGTKNPLIEIIVPKYGEKSSSIHSDKHTDTSDTSTKTSKNSDISREIIVPNDANNFPRKIFGINGGANQCYSNALFQMLYSIPEMRKTFTKTNENTNNVTTILFMNRFKKIYNTTINTIYQGDDSCLAKEYNNHTLQHDVNEIFKWFIKQFESSNIHSIKRFLKIFKFIEHTDFLCDNNNESIGAKLETNETIELPINIKDNKNVVNDINDLLQNYSKYEPLEQSNHMYSESCGHSAERKPNVTHKKIRIELPNTNKYIVICLRRFKSDGGLKRSKSDEVVQPYTQTKIRKKITPNSELTIDNKIYTLTGVICHRGHIEKQGHYVYYECDSQGKYIRLYNDSIIKEYNNVESSYENEINTDGYMFLYSLNNYDAQNENTNGKDNNTVLFDYFEDGNISNVKQHLDEGGNVDSQNQDGNTALILASEDGNLGLCKLLINKGSNVNLQNNDGDTAFMMASMYGRKEVFELLINKVSNVDMKNKDGWTALMLASDNGRETVCQILINAKSNVDMQNNNGDTALMLASSRGYIEICQILINAKSNVDMPNNNGDTALIVASRNGSRKVCKLLIDNGSNVDMPNNNGDTALIVASSRGDIEICEMLINAKSNVNLQNNYGSTALILASRNGREAVCELLITRGCNVDMHDKNGNTALMDASYYGHIPIVISLIAAGCDYSLKNNEGKSAMDYLIERHPGNVVEVQNEIYNTLKLKTLKV